MTKGLDLMMSMDENDDWLRTSKQEARRKTDYEKKLEKDLLTEAFSHKICQRNLETARVQKKIMFWIIGILTFLLVAK